jgi:hypothetical protein
MLDGKTETESGSGILSRLLSHGEAVPERRKPR